MEECKAVATPLIPNQKLTKDEEEEKVDESQYRSLIGSLLYLTATRPNMLFVVSVLSRFMTAPRKTHMVMAKHVLRYLKGTSSYGVWYEAKAEGELRRYTDSDGAGSLDDARSTSGYVFSFGSVAFSWASRSRM